MSKWSEKEIKYLIDNFAQTLYIEMENHLGRTHQSISKKAWQLSLKQDKDVAYSTRTYNINKDFFKEPNLINSYWAGFIAADGNIFKNQVKIQINNKDRILLERLKKDINFTGNIIEHKGRFCSSNSYTKSSSSISFSNQNIVNDLLKNFNICGNKSLILESPTNLSFDNSLAFIIGNLDGDGSILKIKNRPSFLMRFHGTYSLLDWIKEILSQIYKIDRKIVSCGNIYRLEFSGNYSKEIGITLKSIPILKLDRKWGII